MSIADNLAAVRERTAAAAARSGRNADDIRLIAVTKTVGADIIREALQAGITDIGENYVQDAARKHHELGPLARWHMIGHLQSNKARQAVGIFDLIQSVDSGGLAREIGRRSSDAGRTSAVLVEVNVSGEATRTGVPPEEALALCGEASEMPGLALQGLMGIAPFTDDVSEIRRAFAGLRELYDRLPPANRIWLSMGMTSDFEIAIEEGSNMIRVGTAIFGPRQRIQEGFKDER